MKLCKVSDLKGGEILAYMDDIKQYYPRNMLPKDIVADIKGLLHKRRLEQLRRKENRDAR